MEIVLAIFSWVFSIAFVLTILSAPTELVISKLKKDWRGSKGEKAYRKGQFALLGISVLTLLITVVLMTSTH